MYKEGLLIFDILKTLCVHLDELLIIESLALIIAARIRRLIPWKFQNLMSLLFDIDLLLFEFTFLVKVDLIPKFFHFLFIVVAKLHSLLENLFERWTLLNGSSRVTDCRVKFRP